MTADQLFKLADQVAKARRFVEDTPQEVLSTRQQSALAILLDQCQDFSNSMGER